MVNDFNTVAWCYDFLAELVFGSKLKKSQQVLLKYVEEGDKVLMIGGGTGWLLNELLKQHSKIHIDYLETSIEMIKRAQKRISKEDLDKINFIHGSEEYLVKNDFYDCVFCCYFFDLFIGNRLREIIRLLASSLKIKGVLLVVDFNLTINSSRFHKLLMKLMYLFFTVTSKVESKTLVPFRKELSYYFKSNKVIASFMNGFILSEVYTKEQ